MTNKEFINQNLDKIVYDVPGFPKEGIIFKDIVPTFEKPEYANKLIDAMLDEIKDNNIQFDKILCPESRGFLFGVPLGLKLNKPIVLARKHGKLPRGGIEVSYDLEYGQAKLQISKDSIKEGDKVLIVDDLLATGGSSKALAELVTKSNGSVSGMLFFIELVPLKGREKISEYKVMSISPIMAY